MTTLAQQAYGKLSLRKHLAYATIEPGKRDPVTGEATEFIIRRRWRRQPLPEVQGFDAFERDYAPPIDADVEPVILNLLQERVVVVDAVKMDVEAEPLVIAPVPP